jgi:histidinol-phosphate phosphatase family protein
MRCIQGVGSGSRRAAGTVAAKSRLKQGSARLNVLTPARNAFPRRPRNAIALFARNHALFTQDFIAENELAEMLNTDSARAKTIVIVGDSRGEQIIDPAGRQRGDAHESPNSPAVFFDIDGVLNAEPGGDGVLRPEEVILFPGASAAVRRARAAGFRAVGVTNRAQVAKGLVTFEQLERILGHLQTLLSQDGDALDRIYACPHYPDRSFPGGVPELQIACECRKPGTLLFRRAIEDLAIDASRSFVIGDSLRDIGAARALGMTAYGVRTGYGCKDVDRYRGPDKPSPDRMFDSVVEAVDDIERSAAI